jgi:hypothetical protein
MAPLCDEGEGNGCGRCALTRATRVAGVGDASWGLAFAKGAPTESDWFRGTKEE